MLTSPENSCDVTLQIRTRTNSETAAARSFHHRELVDRRMELAVREIDGALIRRQVRPCTKEEHRKLGGKREDSQTTKTTPEKTMWSMITMTRKTMIAICSVSTAESSFHHPIRTALTGSIIVSDEVRRAVVMKDRDVVARKI